jgi:hypothetical protein
LISRKGAKLREAAEGFKVKYCGFDLNFAPLREVGFGKLDHYRKNRESWLLIKGNNYDKDNRSTTMFRMTNSAMTTFL